MKKEKTLLALSITLTLFALFLIFTPSVPKFGSVGVSGEYYSTTTTSTLTSTGKVLKTGDCTLGSVVITLTSNAPLAIYDATTTGPHSDHATTTLAIFKTTTVGTYTFDTKCSRGLLIVSDSTVGVASSTITFR